MSNFMPINAAAAQELNDRLSSTIFKSVSDFVKFYNSGLINKKNDEVTKIVAEVTAAFKDVKEKGGELVFLSSSEVLLNEAIAALQPWEILVRAKREANDLIAAGTISRDSTLAFSKKNAGFILQVTEETETSDSELVKVGSEKLFGKIEEVAPIFDRKLIDGERDGDTFIFYATDLADLDDSFIARVHEVLPV